MGKCCVCHCGHSINANVHSLSLKRARKGEMVREQSLWALTIWNDDGLGSPHFCLPRGPQHCPSIQFISPKFSFTHLMPCFPLPNPSYCFKWAKPFGNSVSIFSPNLSVPIIQGNFMVSVNNQSNQPGRNQICNEEPSTLPLTHGLW